MAAIKLFIEHMAEASPDSLAPFKPSVSGGSWHNAPFRELGMVILGD